MDYNQIHYRNIKGLNIRYRESKKPGAPILLMTNAWPQSIRCWDSTWPSLSRQFHLLAIDMPGFGMSDGIAQMMTPSAQGEFFVDILDAFGIECVHGIGPDVGVPAMLWFAQNHPERISSLVIFDGPGFYPPKVSLAIKALIASRLVRQALARSGNFFAFEAMRRGYRHYKPTRDALAEYRKFNRVKGSFPGTLDYLASYPEQLHSIGNGLPHMTAPVLILWGKDDPFVLAENATELHHRIPKSELHILAGCGHFAHEDAGNEFVSLVEGWIERSKLFSKPPATAESPLKI